MSVLPSPSKDFPAWYGAVVRGAGLAENSSVRGAMVIKPYGYAIWEAIQRELDDRIKATGHENERIEHVVKRTERYVVVDKFGDAERIAEQQERRDSVE